MHSYKLAPRSMWAFNHRACEEWSSLKSFSKRQEGAGKPLLFIVTLTALHVFFSFQTNNKSTFIQLTYMWSFTGPLLMHVCVILVQFFPTHPHSVDVVFLLLFLQSSLWRRWIKHKVNTETNSAKDWQTQPTCPEFPRCINNIKLLVSCFMLSHI